MNLYILKSALYINADTKRNNSYNNLTESIVLVKKWFMIKKDVTRLFFVLICIAILAGYLNDKKSVVTVNSKKESTNNYVFATSYNTNINPLERQSKAK